VGLDPDSGLEYCDRCNPRYPRVKPSDLEQLYSVPAAYRRLVELDILHDLPRCGDVEFLLANDLIPARQALPCIEKNPHLQPFAHTGAGDLWCWTPFRTGANREPEILRVADWQVVVDGPTFLTFLYRTALETVTGQWSSEPDEPAAEVGVMAVVLAQLGADELADDLEVLAGRPVTDCTPSDLRAHGLRWRGLLGESEFNSRIERHLGTAYLEQVHGPGFLQTA
jgi:hypothetical protein